MSFHRGNPALKLEKKAKSMPAIHAKSLSPQVSSCARSLLAASFAMVGVSLFFWHNAYAFGSSAPAAVAPAAPVVASTPAPATPAIPAAIQPPLGSAVSTPASTTSVNGNQTARPSKAINKANAKPQKTSSQATGSTSSAEAPRPNNPAGAWYMVNASEKFNAMRDKLAQIVKPEQPAK